jgi:hypothetical protein
LFAKSTICVGTGALSAVAAAEASRSDTHIKDFARRLAREPMRPEPLVQALAGSEVREAGAVLRKWSGRAAR